MGSIRLTASIENVEIDQRFALRNGDKIMAGRQESAILTEMDPSKLPWADLGADILILTGHPLLTESVPEAVFIDGEIVYRRKPGARTRINPIPGGEQ